LILLENVAYLADEDQRNAAFAALKKKVGTRPGEILKATQAQLEEVTRIGGIVPALRAQRLRQIAELVHLEFQDDLAAELRRPLSHAKTALKKFPTIGDPGAEKILMLTRQPSAAGARVQRPACPVAPGFRRREEELLRQLSRSAASVGRAVALQLRRPHRRSPASATARAGTVQTSASALCIRLSTHCGLPLLPSFGERGASTFWVTTVVAFSCCNSSCTRFQTFRCRLVLSGASGFA
jgi:hypothetical protein